MARKVEFSTPSNSMTPIGPYSHVAKVRDFITIGAVAGVDPQTGELAGSDIASQTTQILDAFELILASVGSDLTHVIHINVFLKDMQDFDAMNEAYARRMGDARPATRLLRLDFVRHGAVALPETSPRIRDHGWTLS